MLIHQKFSEHGEFSSTFQLCNIISGHGIWLTLRKVHEKGLKNMWLIPKRKTTTTMQKRICHSDSSEMYSSVKLVEIKLRLKNETCF